ncbi:MAG: twin-arginine translocase subunit TatC [Candidatus Omnitrophota bacterium]|jgi:sec-independent protein translocase protein TatC
MEQELTFIGHLDELRRRVIISLVSLGIAAVASLPLSPYILKALKYPAGSAIQKLAFFGPEEAFMVYMRIGIMCGVIIASPVIVYEFWAFIAPAIEDKFKKNMAYFIVFSLASFIAGCAFSYYILLPKGLAFLLNFGSEDLVPIISATKYISFATGLILACGIVFQMPVLSFILTRIGVINASFLRRKFKYAVIVIGIFSAIITPTTDIFNMIVLMIPMILLYEISVWISAIARR